MNNFSYNSEKHQSFIKLSIEMLLNSNNYSILSCHLSLVNKSTSTIYKVIGFNKLKDIIKSILNAKLPLKAILHLISIRICILVGVNIETFIKNTTLHMV